MPARAGSLPGGLSFEGPAELMEILRRHKREDFCRCLTKKMLTYALGRELRPSDKPAIDRIVRHVHADHGRLSTVVLEIVKSHPFRHKANQP